ncbi:hypothetical protein SARI_02233 [Salmonella enterica subsp. arizonae serovar 62:z4,z23:-]|uniref:Uncharacterized protein n=1 Tax=Salmonella arizonae (strain ATCC BAA-731 / CDC346-86 / RSK2980) TaxID=41514 RepID=A9MK86_SALAR|nr:hypothetical protein SARI_02233 [Salmonella enterica subsp. arizonae serovar 62:z4,z23:-]
MIIFLPPSPAVNTIKAKIQRATLIVIYRLGKQRRAFINQLTKANPMMVDAVHSTADQCLQAKNKNFIFMSSLVTIADRGFTAAAFGYDPLTFADYF